jgi:hypothetical protein
MCEALAQVSNAAFGGGFRTLEFVADPAKRHRWLVLCGQQAVQSGDGFESFHEITFVRSILRCGKTERRK